MPLVAFSVKLDRIDESLLYQDKGGGWWLSAVCTLERDSKGRTVVVQSIPKERYAAGERGLAVGTWREIGQPKPPSSGGKGFDLTRYKKPSAPDQVPSATGGGRPAMAPYSQTKRRELHDRTY